MAFGARTLGRLSGTADEDGEAVVIPGGVHRILVRVAGDAYLHGVYHAAPESPAPAATEDNTATLDAGETAELDLRNRSGGRFVAVYARSGTVNFTVNFFG